MKLDKNYRLTSDDDNYILQRKRKRANGSKANEWQNIGYWKDLGQALEAYSNGVKRASLPTTLDELLQLQHANTAHWRAMCEPLGQGALDASIWWAYYPGNQIINS